MQQSGFSGTKANWIAF